MKRKDIEKGVGVFFIAVSCLIALIASQVQVAYATTYPWPMFHHDPSRTGYTTSWGPTTNNILWAFNTGDFITSSPAVVDGVVYVGSNDTYVYALDAWTGIQKWRFGPMGNGTWSSPAVAGGIVYIGSNDNNTYAINATNGAEIWRHTAYAYMISSPVVVGGVVYIGGTDSLVYALNATTGKCIWNTTVWGGITSSPAVVDGKVYVGSAQPEQMGNRGNLTALDAATGNLIWNHTLPTGPWFSSPAVAGGIVYIGTFGYTTTRPTVPAYLVAYNASTGKTVWNKTFSSARVNSSPAVAYGIVYVGIAYPLSMPPQGGVLAFDALTGAPKWTRTLNVDVYSSPAVAAGIVYVGADDSKVYALNASTGVVKWSSQSLAAVIRSCPAIADGVLYVGSGGRPPATAGKKVYAFGTRPVGGIWIEPNVLDLLAPWIVLASTMTSAMIIAFVFSKYRKKKK